MQAVQRILEKLEQGRRAYLVLFLLGLLFLVPGLKNLPPTDRDESRFAQATKQMIETGNYIDIRFQEVPRYKKPIGIYWLQAAAVELAGQPLNTIWPYRIPSLLGALAAVLGTCFFGSRLFNRRVGLIAGALLVSSLLLGVEARLAKTDASMLATIVLMQGSLGLLYLQRHERSKGAWPLALAFWIACGAGILIKGPPAPVIAGMTILTLLIADRQWRLLRCIRPEVGLPLLAAIVLPWFIAIQHASGGEFMQKAFFGDFVSKLLSGQESHGAPPGFYLLLFPVLFWPSSLLAIRYLPDFWQRRREDTVRFLLAWIIPSWIIFELVPTKLPHYVLPFFPAIALLIATALHPANQGLIETGRVRRVLAIPGYFLWGLATLLLFIGLPLLPTWFHQFHPWHILPFAGGLLVLRAGLRLKRQMPPLSLLPFLLLGALLVLPQAFADILPGLNPAWPSSEVARLLADQPPGQLVSVGYGEPSLPFLIGTKTRLTDAADATRIFFEPGWRYLLLEGRQKARFEEMTPVKLDQLKLVARFDSYNYSKGKRLNLELYAKP